MPKRKRHNHIEVFRKHHNLAPGEWFGCQICNATYEDIHHIIPRSQGGGDEIDNLIALCRCCHDRAHFKREPYLEEVDLRIALTNDLILDSQ